MPIGGTYAISDVCLLVEDIERTVAFYVDKLGFRLRRRAEGFADFHGEGVTLAAWEIDHISQHAGVSKLKSPRHAHKVCVAVQLDTPGEIDRLHAELTAKGVPFYGPPENYVW